jgi:hypothetical protein
LDPLARVLLLALRVLQLQIDVAQRFFHRVYRCRLTLLLWLRPSSALSGLLCRAAPALARLPAIAAAAVAALTAVFPVEPAFAARAFRAPVPVVLPAAAILAARNH